MCEIYGKNTSIPICRWFKKPNIFCKLNVLIKLLYCHVYVQSERPGVVIPVRSTNFSYCNIFSSIIQLYSWIGQLFEYCLDVIGFLRLKNFSIWWEKKKDNLISPQIIQCNCQVSKSFTQKIFLKNFSSQRKVWRRILERKFATISFTKCFQRSLIGEPPK